MIVELPTLSVEWNGGHTANVYDMVGNNVDCFTFAWEKNNPTQLDFTNALERWLSNE